MRFDEFLREIVPPLGLQWRPFQRKGIKRKVERRISEIGLSQIEEYLSRIKEDPQEQSHLSKILTITISRFFRDGEVFHTIGTSVIPEILKDKSNGNFRIWSIGCASGEEPYSLSILWKERFEKNWPRIHLSVLATDIDEGLLKRAKEGIYKKSSLKEVPEKIIKDFFRVNDAGYLLDSMIRESVEFMRHDIIRDDPLSGMDIVFCRNLAFTYFSRERQIDVLGKIATCLEGGGYLVIGKDENLPLTYPTLFVPVFQREGIYQKFNSTVFPLPR